MKIVVIGGTGLIGSKLVTRLREHRHDALAAAPNTGVNTITGEDLASALRGASVVVDVSNSPSFEDEAALAFFETSTRNLLAAEAEAGVGHHVALSVVGTERLPDSGYLRAKLAQERLVRDSSIPQFHRPRYPVLRFRENYRRGSHRWERGSRSARVVPARTGWRMKRPNPIGRLIVTRRHISSLSAAIWNGCLRLASM